jgi:hypothetical protein
VDIARYGEAVDALTAEQERFLDAALGRWAIEADLSWPLQDTRVLRVRSGDRQHIVKAARADRPISHHIGREIDAYRGVLSRLVRSDDPVPVPRLDHHDRRLGLIVTRHVPGQLVLGTDAEGDPRVYEQAGRILARLLVPGEVSDSYSAALVATTKGLVARARGLVPEDRLAAVLSRLDAVRPRPVRLSSPMATSSRAIGSCTMATSASSTSAGQRSGPGSATSSGSGTSSSWSVAISPTPSRRVWLATWMLLIGTFSIWRP